MRSDWGYGEEEMAPWPRSPLMFDPPVCDALRTGEAVYLGTHDEWEHYIDLRSRIQGLFATLAAVPLRFGGVVSAALVLTMREEHRFMAGDRAFLAALADHAAQALERARLFEERAYGGRLRQGGRGRLLRRLRHPPGPLAGGGRRRRRQGHRGGGPDRARAAHAARDRA